MGRYVRKVISPAKQLIYFVTYLNRKTYRIPSKYEYLMFYSNMITSMRMLCQPRYVYSVPKVRKVLLKVFMMHSVRNIIRH